MGQHWIDRLPPLESERWVEHTWYEYGNRSQLNGRQRRPLLWGCRRDHCSFWLQFSRRPLLSRWKGRKKRRRKWSISPESYFRLLLILPWREQALNFSRSASSVKFPDLLFCGRELRERNWDGGRTKWSTWSTAVAKSSGLSRRTLSHATLHPGRLDPRPTGRLCSAGSLLHQDPWFYETWPFRQRSWLRKRYQ